MVVDTVKENLSVNKLVAEKKEVLIIEGDMIVPDSKPDILNTICTSGVETIYKKEVLDEKIRIDGNINVYIMYLSDDPENKVRGINTNLDFSEIIALPNVQSGMSCSINTKIKSIETKVINGRKVGIKATLEVDLKVYANEDIEIINEIENAEGLQILKENLSVNSLVGTGDTKIYAKDTISIDNIDNLAEILKVNINICDKDIKISYQKILTKAEAEVKLLYLTEDNRIKSITTKIPVVGFIDIPNVVEENICDINYEIKNIVIKPNPVDEHSIYVEIETQVYATVYEEKQINLIQDLYSPSENLEFNKKNVMTIRDMTKKQEIKQIREQVNLENMGNKNIIDVDINMSIENENSLSNRVIYEGNLEMKFILGNQDLDLDIKKVKIPFEYVLEPIEGGENRKNNLEIEVLSKDFIIQDGGNVSANIDMLMNTQSYKNTNLSVIDEIETGGEREKEDYGLIIYIVKKDDTLWKIAKKFGSTVDDIVRANGIEDANKIFPGDKLYIPRYVKTYA